MADSERKRSGTVGDASSQQESADAGASPDPILDIFHKIAHQARAAADLAARDLELSPPALMALGQLSDEMPMRELAAKLRCERSFVTAIADELEQRALIRREPDRHDRRTKRLVLTPEGIAMRGRLQRDFFAHLPWQRALDDAERGQLLDLLTKSLGVVDPTLG